MQKVKFHLKATQPSSSITASPSRQQSSTEQSSSTNHIAPVTSGGLESKIATTVSAPFLNLIVSLFCKVFKLYGIF